jgi:hypothetical protein
VRAMLVGSALTVWSNRALASAATRRRARIVSHLAPGVAAAAVPGAR